MYIYNLHRHCHLNVQYFMQGKYIRIDWIEKIENYMNKF